MIGSLLLVLVWVLALVGVVFVCAAAWSRVPSEPPTGLSNSTWGEVTDRALLDRAYAAYLADEIDLGEFEWQVEEALRGRAPAADMILKDQYAVNSVYRPPRTLQDAVREGKAVGPREHIPQVLAEADMDRKIASQKR